MGAPTAGYTGNVKIGSNTILNIKSDQFDLQAAMEDITSMLASPTGFKVFQPTLNEASCTLTANWDLTDTTGQLAMQNAWLNRTLLSFVLTPNGGTNTYSFSAYIKKISVKDDVSKINEASYDLQPTGAVTTT